MNHMRRMYDLFLACVAIVALSSPSRGEFVTYTYTGTGTGANAGWSATAEFILVGGVNGELDIILTNTSVPTTRGGGNVVLTGLAFNTSNTLTAQSAQLGSGASAVYSPASPYHGNNPGSGWGFGGTYGGYSDVLSASGAIMSNSPPSHFDSTSHLGLSSGSPGGAAGYGILSEGTTLNNGQAAKGPYFTPSLEFTLYGFNTINLGGTVLFQFGTNARTEPQLISGPPVIDTPPVHVTPEPSSLAIAGLGILTLAAFLRRRKTAASAPPTTTP